MTDNDWRTSVPPFPSEYRASGLLLHVTSLPSPYGVGDLGSSSRCRPEVVAGATARPHWLRKLALSINVVVCRQRVADQSRLSHFGHRLIRGRRRGCPKPRELRPEVPGNASSGERTG